MAALTECSPVSPAFGHPQFENPANFRAHLITGAWLPARALAATAVAAAATVDAARTVPLTRSSSPLVTTPRTHAGQEIWEQTAGRVDAFVSGAGTGGTLAGVSLYLKQRRPGVRVYLIDPPGSGLYNKVGGC